MACELSTSTTEELSSMLAKLKELAASGLALIGITMREESMMAPIMDRDTSKQGRPLIILGKRREESILIIVLIWF